MMTICIFVAHPRFYTRSSRALFFADITCQCESCGGHVLYRRLVFDMQRARNC